MTVLNDLYRCDICGNIVEIVQEGADALVCCGEEMKKIEVETQEPVKGEKHTPVLVNGEDGEFYIKIGESEHPMTDEHFIAFIEAFSTDGKYLTRKFLKEGEKPELKLECKCSNMVARALCNIHGLWQSILSKNN